MKKREMRLVAHLLVTFIVLISADVYSSAESTGANIQKIKCNASPNHISEGKLIELAKIEIRKREGNDASSYSEIDAMKTKDNCKWIVFATRVPAGPGLQRVITFTNLGKLVEYDLGK